MLKIGEVFNDNDVEIIIIANEKITCTGCYYQSHKLHNLSRCVKPRDLAEDCIDSSYSTAEGKRYRKFIKYERLVTKLNLTE